VAQRSRSMGQLCLLRGRENHFMHIGFTCIGREVALLLRCFVDGIRHSDTCPLVLRQGPHVQDKIRSCISQKGVLRVEQSKNNTLCRLCQFTVYILSRIGQYPCTRAQGWGFGGVAERLPAPAPTYTPPATRMGLPDPCHCLFARDLIIADSGLTLHANQSIQPKMSCRKL
jgi:hypothetical protein